MATFTLPDDPATGAFGAALAGHLRAGDAVLLTGPVGAGKSTLCRAIIRNRLGRAEDVPSPTFTLVQTYNLETCQIWHADLYRLTAVAEVDELGLIDAFDDHICLVEWADRLGSLSPVAALRVDIAITPEDTRTLSLDWDSPRWNTVTEALTTQGAGRWQPKTK